MGRKIPGKKHRGVKDREKQHADRWAELSTKINAPPKNIDDQEIPKSLERLIKLKDDVKIGKISDVKKKKRKKKSHKGLIILSQPKEDKISHSDSEPEKPHRNSKPEKAVPVFNQKSGESPFEFWNRVNRETHNFINETAFEDKYGVQVKRNPETGEVEGLEKRPKDELDELAKLKMKHKNIKKKKKKKKLEELKLSKVEKRKAKLKIKKEKKLEKMTDEFALKKDEVKFGEIVHAPPDLKVKPFRADKLIKVKHKSLILNSILKDIQSNSNATSKPTAPVDKRIKRKKMPLGERRILENQQNSVVEAYKLLKARKSLNKQ